MNACEAMIDIELSTNESRAQKFARNAREILDKEATIVKCPDCGGDGYLERDCDCKPDPAGCQYCGYRGWMPIACNTCKGDGEVLQHKNGKIEVLL